MDDAFRKQMESTEESHQRALTRLEEDREEEVSFANKRVCMFAKICFEFVKLGYMAFISVPDTGF